MGESSSHSITRTTLKARCWSITLNNPSDEEVALWKNIAQHAPWVKSAHGQIEKGAEGTPHIQGMLKTDQVRFSAVKKLLPRAHIEVARSEHALEAYVSKEDTRLETLQSSKRNVLMATPATIQQHLFDSFYDKVLGGDLDAHHIDDSAYFAYARKIDGACADNECNREFFVFLLRNSPEWIEFFDTKGETIMRVVYNALIQKGYYNVEFIAANNLLHTAFKKNIRNILIRHALRPSLPPPSPQEHSPPHEEDHS